MYFRVIAFLLPQRKKRDGNNKKRFYVHVDDTIEMYNHQISTVIKNNSHYTGNCWDIDPIQFHPIQFPHTMFGFHITWVRKLVKSKKLADQISACN